MAENTFCKIKDIPGEGTEKNHVGWIPIKQLGWEVARTLDMTDLSTTQRGYANANFDKVKLTSEVSKATAKLMLSVANGTSREEIIVEMCRSGASASEGMEPYLIWKLKDAVIDSYTVSGGEEQIPEEEWSVAYRSIEVEYKIADYKTGKLTKENDFKWDLESGGVG